MYNLDMLAIARTTKLTASGKENAEDETTETVNSPGPLLETEFYGGEQADEPENEEIGEDGWRAMYVLPLDRIKTLLCRQSEAVSYTHLTLPTKRIV